MITVYTQPGCRPCKRVVNKIQEAQLPYTVIDVSVDEDGMEYLRSIGAKGVPVVRADNGYSPIVGYQPDLLKYLLETYQLDNGGGNA